VKRLRSWDPRRINVFYFSVLTVYVAIGVAILLSGLKPKGLVEIYSCIANFAIGYSCFHVLAVNLTLLPRPLRPGLTNRILLCASGFYFLMLAGITVYFEIEKGNVLLGTMGLAVMGTLLVILLVYLQWVLRKREKPVTAE
jgi:hypothetical protein